MLIPRSIAPLVDTALHDTPAVYIQGPRQAGKSTLVRTICDKTGRHYLSLDDAATLAAARADPGGFLSRFDGPIAIDEVQTVPELARALKAAIDLDRRPGRFLLTGSAGIMVIPGLASHLVGRMELLTLWPLAQREIAEIHGTWIDDLFAERFIPGTIKSQGRQNVLERLIAGGYPEPVRREAPESKARWFNSYETTILQRDVHDLASVENLGVFPALLRLLAGRDMSILNVADVARTLSLPQTSVKRYLAVLSGLFLIRTLPAWHRQASTRLAKAPKAMLVDTAFACHLAGLDQNRLEANPTQAGHLVENLAAMELIKQAGWAKTKVDIFHFRTLPGTEVDIVLEDRRGRVAGVEVKFSQTLSKTDLRGMESLRQTAGSSFLRGIILYTGHETLPFGPDCWAIPIGTLWF
jgi:predicted AAA+ superfamily ATPase